jgi:hypothetical protein
MTDIGKRETEAELFEFVGELRGALVAALWGINHHGDCVADFERSSEVYVSTGASILALRPEILSTAAQIENSRQNCR